MKVAAKVSLLTALCAAAGILIACIVMFAAYRANTLDSQIRMAETQYSDWSAAFRAFLTDSSLPSDMNTRAGFAGIRYASHHIKGTSDIALYSENSVIVNNTGIDARRFLVREGQPAPDTDGLLYGFLHSGETMYLVLGPGADISPGVYLVRVVTDIWSRIEAYGLVCMLVGAGAVLLSAVSIFLLVRRMLRPLTEVRDSMSAVASGRYDVTIRIPSSHDEFSQLARDCQSMSGAIRNKVEQLEQVSQERKMLLSAIAHEMRTPITAIAGLAQCVQGVNMPEDRRAELLHLIRTESLRLERMSAKLTALLAAGGTAPELTELRASDFAKNAEQTLHTAAGDADFEMRTVNDAVWRAEPDLLQIAAANLVDNSRKSGASHIWVALDADGIIIRDDGCGIAPELLPHVTEPFRKGDPSRSSEGFGLGLALVSRIVHAHGGSLGIESVPGSGTCVHIRLPKT